MQLEEQCEALVVPDEENVSGEEGGGRRGQRETKAVPLSSCTFTLTLTLTLILIALLSPPPPPPHTQVSSYHAMLCRLSELQADLRALTTAPKNCLPFLQPGRLVRVRGMVLRSGVG
jgi:hypothetical protein